MGIGSATTNVIPGPHLWRRGEVAWCGVLVALFAVLGLMLRLGSGAVLVDILDGFPVLCLLAVAQTAVLRIGFADPASVAVSGLAGVVAMRTAVSTGVPLVATVAVAVLIGFVVGGLNGVIAARAGALPALGAGLGAWFAASWLTTRIAGDHELALNETVLPLDGHSDRRAAAVALAVLVVVVVFAAATGRRSGRRANLVVRESNGPVPESLIIRRYVISGVISAVAGLTNVVLAGTAEPVPDEFFISVFTAALVGGASVLGGYGGALSALAGTLVLLQIWRALAGFGFDASSVPTVLVTICVGALAVVADIARRKWILGRARWEQYSHSTSAWSADEPLRPPTSDSFSDRVREVERTGQGIGRLGGRLITAVVVWWLLCLVEAAMLYFLIPDGFPWRIHIYVAVYAITLLATVGVAVLKSGRA